MTTTTAAIRAAAEIMDRYAKCFDEFGYDTPETRSAIAAIITKHMPAAPAPEGDKSELEQLIETWIEQSADFSTVSPDDAEDLLLRLIAYESGQRERTRTAIVGLVRAEAKRLGAGWINDVADAIAAVSIDELMKGGES